MAIFSERIDVIWEPKYELKSSGCAITLAGNEETSLRAAFAVKNKVALMLRAIKDLTSWSNPGPIVPPWIDPANFCSGFIVERKHK